MSELIDRSAYFAGPGMLGGSFEQARAGEAPAAPGQAVFYELARKFVETEDDVPEDAKDVLYYTLAVGHHTGVLDCFEPRVAVPLPILDAVVEDMGEGEGARKLACLREFGEVQVDKENVAPLLEAALELRERLGYRGSRKAGIDFLDPDFGRHTQEIAFLGGLIELLERVRDVQGVYACGRLQ